MLVLPNTWWEKKCCQYGEFFLVLYIWAVLLDCILENLLELFARGASPVKFSRNDKYARDQGIFPLNNLTFQICNCMIWICRNFGSSFWCENQESGCLCVCLPWCQPLWKVCIWRQLESKEKSVVAYSAQNWWNALQWHKRCSWKAQVGFCLLLSFNSWR